jgi:hypothetical protein
MIGCLLLLAAAWPQEPVLEGRVPIAEVLRAVGEEVGASQGLDPILQGLRSRTRRIEGPALGVELRAAGLGAPDLARAVFEPLAQEEASWEALLSAVSRAHGDRSAVRPARRRGDLDDFEREVSHVHRDLIQALGGRQDPDRAFAHWGGIVDRLQRQGVGDNADDTARDAAEASAGMDPEELRSLAGRLLRAAAALDVEELRSGLRGVTARPARSDGAVQGDVFLDRDGPFGRLVVGGFGPNSYDCTQIDVLVDLGGADEYRGPAGGAGGLRRLGVVVDLGGDDVYRGGQDGLGSATFGIGVLFDREGDDRYEAVGRGLGFGVAGVGYLVDVEGDDRYVAGGLSVGVGCHGTGALADLDGNDVYELRGPGAGLGLPGGLGLFWDRAGDDRIECELEPGAFGGLGAGIGTGSREDGGLGVAVDAAGDDRVVGLVGGAGVGVDRGVGFAWDVAGADEFVCGSRSLGFGIGAGLGILVDEAGDDRRTVRAMSLGGGQDGGVGIAVDVSGDDVCAAGHPSLGEGRIGGLGLYADLAGADRYRSARVDGEPAAGPRRTRVRVALGLLLDCGGGADVFDFDRAPGLLDGQSRRIDGDGEEPWIRHLVDRDAPSDRP